MCFIGHKFRTPWFFFSENYFYRFEENWVFSFSTDFQRKTKIQAVRLFLIFESKSNLHCILWPTKHTLNSQAKKLLNDCARTTRSFRTFDVLVLHCAEVEWFYILLFISGKRRRHPVSVGDLLLHRGASQARSRVDGREAAGAEREDRDGGSPGQGVLPRRRIPPAVPREGRRKRREAICRERMQWPHQMLWLIHYFCIIGGFKLCCFSHNMHYVLLCIIYIYICGWCDKISMLLLVKLLNIRQNGCFWCLWVFSFQHCFTFLLFQKYWFVFELVYTDAPTSHGLSILGLFPSQHA